MSKTLWFACSCGLIRTAIHVNFNFADVHLDNQEAACGCSVHTKPYGTLMSPSYPDNHPYEANCKWRIEVDPGQVSLRISVRNDKQPCIYLR